MATQQREDAIQLKDIIEEFSTAMLVTLTENDMIRARPMQIATSDGTDLWFVTGRHTGKVDEIVSHPGVGVTLQSSNRWVSLSGKMAIVDDRQLIHKLWQENWKVWFPKGKDDPEITLLRLDSGQGEYWDNAGSKGVGLWLEMGRAYLSGDRAKVPKPNHGKVDVR